MLGIEGVALGEEVLARAGFRRSCRACRAIAGAERLALVTRAVEEDGFAPPPHRDARVKVRQPVQPSGRLHGEPARSVEREEPDPGPSAARHVRPHIQLEEAGDARQRQRPAGAQAGDRKGRDADPAAARVLFHFQDVGNELADRLDRHPVVHEEQVVPGLSHHPRPRRERPRAMLGLFERRRLADRRLEQLQPTRDCRGAPALFRSPRKAP